MILFRLSIMALVLCQGIELVAQETTAEPESTLAADETLQPLDIFELEFATDPQISPDGSRIVYVRNQFDIMKDRRVSTLWMLENGRHYPLLDDGVVANSPRWSPDGSQLAYVVLADDGRQIFRWNGNRSIRVTRLTESPGGISWSPDGQWLAFSMRIPGSAKPFAKLPAKPDGAEWAADPVMITRLRYRSDGGGYLPEGFTQLFVVPSAGGTPRQLTEGEFNHGGGLSWTPDNRSIVFSANRHPDADYQPANSEIYQVDIHSRKIRQLTDRIGPDNGPVVSPDGNWIAYTGFDDQQLGHQSNRIYLMSTRGEERKELAAGLDRRLGSLAWNEQSNGVYFQFDDFGQTRLASAHIDGSVNVLVGNVGGESIGRPYASGSYSVSDDGVIAFTCCSTSRPADIAQRDSQGSVTQLTQLNEDLFRFKELGEVEEIEFKSTHDGLNLQGWVIKPPKFDPEKKYPLILEIHGGPFSNYGSRFSGELQLMAAAGYVVLYMNPRGSTSYGQAFANQIHHNYPGNDYDDLMSGVNEVLARGYVDSENLFVTGGSGGGVLTAWIVGRTDRFRAAVVAKPVINWYSFALTADMYNYFYKYWFPGFPWDYPEEYMKRSPISLVGNVTTPTMLLTGTEDYRTPISETEQYYQALKLRKVDTALVRIPGASHGIASRPSRLIAKVTYILKWFDSHKTPTGGEPATGSETATGND